MNIQLAITNKQRYFNFIVPKPIQIYSRKNYSKCPFGKVRLCEYSCSPYVEPLCWLELMIRLICFMRVVSGHVGGSSSNQQHRFIINEITINPVHQTGGDDASNGLRACKGTSNSENLSLKLLLNFKEKATSSLNSWW